MARLAFREPRAAFSLDINAALTTLHDPSAAPKISWWTRSTRTDARVRGHDARARATLRAAARRLAAKLDTRSKNRPRMSTRATATARRSFYNRRGDTRRAPGAFDGDAKDRFWVMVKLLQFPWRSRTAATG